MAVPCGDTRARWEMPPRSRLLNASGGDAALESTGTESARTVAQGDARCARPDLDVTTRLSRAGWLRLAHPIAASECPVSEQPKYNPGIVSGHHLHRHTYPAEMFVPIETLGAPTSTPGPTLSPGTDQPPPPIVPGDEAQFTAYINEHYGMIAGLAIGIVGVTLDTTEAAVPKVVVELAGGEGNVFVAQTAAAVINYGRRLLSDTKFYFEGQPCAITVVSRYPTANPDTCRNSRLVRRRRTRPAKQRLVRRLDLCPGDVG